MNFKGATKAIAPPKRRFTKKDKPLILLGKINDEGRQLSDLLYTCAN
jgi:hypothetical protein